MTVDVHCHALTPGVEALVGSCPQKLAEWDMTVRMQGEPSAHYNRTTMIPAISPKLTQLQVRLDDMDAMGVDIQVVSPSPTQYYYWAQPELAWEIVRVQNEHIAELCAQAPHRLRGFGNIALQHPQLAVEQLTHCVRQLGLKGIEVSSSVNAAELADARFWPVWSKAQELNCLVFIHPLGTSVGERLNRYYLSNIIGQPLETTIALSQLIFGGVLDHYPGLKILAAHGGGYLPCYAGRSDHAWHARPDARTMAKPLTEYLRQIWFDCLVYEPQAVRRLIEQVGASQVVVGTDYPFDMGHYAIHALLQAVPGLSEAERAAILGGNALQLLG
jgi:aminocarboxymuconate-semialdehyde decarboxylase